MPMDLTAILRLRAEELAKPRNADPRRLTHHGYKAYSQNDEDGILAEIFRRIGTTDRSFVEFGVEHGVQCNSLWLLMQGWSGLWIEGSERHVKTMLKSHAHWLQSGHLAVCRAFITAENINELIGARYKDREIDLLSIDIDFNDFWVWRAIEVVKPRVVVIEYNATWAPPASITVPYSPTRMWQGDNYCGASLGALARLGEHKGYSLVGCCLAGVNAFFVRNDLLQGRFLNPGALEDHYEPARYHFGFLPSGHRPGVGPLVTIE